MKGDIGGGGLFIGGEVGEARNVMLTSQQITILVVCVSVTRSYIFGMGTVRLRHGFDDIEA